MSDQDLHLALADALWNYRKGYDEYPRDSLHVMHFFLQEMYNHLEWDTKLLRSNNYLDLDRQLATRLANCYIKIETLIASNKLEALTSPVEWIRIKAQLQKTYTP